MVDGVTLSEIALFAPHGERNQKQHILGMSEALKAQGFAFFRATRVGTGTWMEGWRKHPADQGEFNIVHVQKVQKEYAS